MEEEFKEMLTTTKQIIKTILNDDELAQLQAQSAMKSFKAFIAEGFSEEQAIQLVAASMKSVK